MVSRQIVRTAATKVYRLFCKGEISLTDAESAEMSKLVENSFRDVNIAFANELANVCEKIGSGRVGGHPVGQQASARQRAEPGPGVGGHCIAVDPWFIVSAAPKQAQLIRLAREINDGRPQKVVDAAANITVQGVRLRA